MMFGEFVPHFFEPNRCVRVAGLPENVHHLAVRMNPGVRARRLTLFDCAANGALEALPVWHGPHHEFPQNFVSVEPSVLPDFLPRARTETLCSQANVERFVVGLGSDHHQRLSGTQSIAEKLGHPFTKKFF
jgi:hypothetical protein